MTKVSTTGIPSAGTDLSREILDDVSGEQSGQPVRSIAARVQEAIDRGADLDWIRRHFHLSDSELRDYCSDIMDDDFDDPDRSASTGY